METRFKTYTGTKTIKAVPMEKAEAEKLLGKSITPATPGTDGYLVEYPDGYRSWCPAKVFEEAYMLSETYLDTLRNELEGIKAKLKVAIEMLYDPKGTPMGGRALLEKQITVMQLYADVLVKRVQAIIEEYGKEDK